MSRSTNTRLLTVAAVAVPVLVALIVFWVIRPGDDTTPDASPDTTPGQTPTGDVDPSSSASPEVSGEWKATAARFARDFVNLAGGREAWLGRLAGSAAPALVEGYRHTDVRLVPVADFRSVTLDEDLTSEGPQRVTVYLNYTNDLTLRAVLEPVAGRWAVTSAEPAEKDDNERTTTA